MAGQAGRRISGPNRRQPLKPLLYRPEAEADLEGIWHYTLGEWGLDQALRYDRQLQEKIEGLAVGTTVSRSADGVRPGLRKVVVGRHVVFFRESAEVVEVVRVLHERMDVGRV